MVKKKSVEYKNLTVKKERRWHFTISLKTILYFFLILFLILGIFYILYKEHIIIYLVHSDNVYDTYLFSVVVSLMLLCFLISCGITIRLTTNKFIKIGLLIFIIYLIYLGFTLVGLGIQFCTNFGLLNYEYYESDSYRGVKFFILNYYPFLFLIYILTLAFMTSEE